MSASSLSATVLCGWSSCQCDLTGYRNSFQDEYYQDFKQDFFLGGGMECGCEQRVHAWPVYLLAFNEILDIFKDKMSAIIR